MAARNAFRHPSFLSDSDKIPDRWRAPSFLSDSSLPPARPLPNQSDVNQRRKSPRCGSTQSLLNTSRATARVPKLGNTSALPRLSRGDNNLCFFCRQGGYVRSCALCNNFASCITNGDLLGCLPENYLDGDRFICPQCYRSTGLTPRYTIPSRSAASSHSGVNTSPLLIYLMYFDEGAHSLAPATAIEGQVRGYYHGKEEQLLILSHAFKDLSDRDEKIVLTKNIAAMTKFMHSTPKCRFVFLLQTHSDPTSGLLHYSDQKCTSISAILEYTFKELRFHQLSNSVLLLSSCGYFLKRHLISLRDSVAASGFKSCFSFTGHALDPLLATVALYYNIFDYHLIGDEPPRKVLERSASTSLLCNTSVVLLDAEDAFLLCGAAIRYRPNGSSVACSACRQVLGYRKMLAGGTAVLYKCHHIEHPNDVSRYKALRLLQPDHATTIGGGANARCRYLVTRFSVEAGAPSSFYDSHIYL